jgi:Fe-S-cluster containining protein
MDTLHKIAEKVSLFEQLRRQGVHDYHIIIAIYSIIDKLVADSAKGESISCRKGCAFCCKMNVDVTDMEGAVILAYCRDNKIPINKDYLAVQATIPKEMLGFTPKIAACVFLTEENTCSIYPVRPLACRKYRVTSAAELCNMEKYPQAMLSVLTDIEAEILVSALDNIQDQQPDGLHKVLLQQLSSQN